MLACVEVNSYINVSCYCVPFSLNEVFLSIAASVFHQGRLLRTRAAERLILVKTFKELPPHSMHSMMYAFFMMFYKVHVTCLFVISTRRGFHQLSDIGISTVNVKDI